MSRRTLGDRYELEELLGRGGMAEVYRAYDRVLHRPVAVKLLSDVSSRDSDRARFTDEALTLARLSHPGLVTILDAATADNRPYLVMELIRGPSLAECCQGTALEPSRVGSIGAQLTDALDYAHRSGVVHRDLKPGNVLLDDRGQARLTDFGIARLMSGTTRHTATGLTMGTAAYLSPEQVRGEDVTPAADIYALGLVLLEALTGHRAFEGSPSEVAVMRLSGSPTIPPTMRENWRELLGSMTALEPSLRPTAGEVREALSRPVSVSTSRTRRQEQSADSTRPLTVPPRAPAGPSTEPTMHLSRDARGVRLADLAAGWKWVAAVMVVALVAVVLLVVRPGGEEEAAGPPADVPPRLEQPLQDLHDAVNGRG